MKGIVEAEPRQSELDGLRQHYFPMLLQLVAVLRFERRQQRFPDGRIRIVLRDLDNHPQCFVSFIGRGNFKMVVAVNLPLLRCATAPPRSRMLDPRGHRPALHLFWSVYQRYRPGYPSSTSPPQSYPL